MRSNDGRRNKLGDGAVSKGTEGKKEDRKKTSRLVEKGVFIPQMRFWGEHPTIR